MGEVYNQEAKTSGLRDKWGSRGEREREGLGGRKSIRLEKPYIT